MFRFMQLGDHPVQRLQMFHMLFADLKKTREHYHECEENCFPQMFYGELPQRVAPLIFGSAIGGALSGLFAPITASLMLVIAVTLKLLGVFATFTYTYSDMRMRHKRHMAMLQENASTEIPDLIMEALKKQFGDSVEIEQVGPSVEGEITLPGNITGMIKLTPVSPPDEDPIAKVLRESGEIARQRAEERKKEGGA